MSNQEKNNQFNPFEQGSINFGLGDLSPLPEQSVTNPFESNNAAPNLDLPSLEGLDLNVVEEVVVEEYNPKTFTSNIDLSNLEMEAQDFISKNMDSLVAKLTSKEFVLEMKEETESLALKNFDDLNWKNDDEMLQAIFHFNAYNEILERAKILQEYYRAVVIDIYNKLDSADKTVDLKVVTISETVNKAKEEIAVKPSSFVKALTEKELDKDFLGSLPNLDWSKMTKGGYDKLVEMIKTSDKALYEKLDKSGFINKKPSDKSYKVSSKL